VRRGAKATTLREPWSLIRAASCRPNPDVDRGVNASVRDALVSSGVSMYTVAQSIGSSVEI
jgi:hypothetical protein